MRYIFLSLCLGFMALSAFPLCTFLSETFGVYGAAALWLLIEVALCMIWLRLSALRLASRGMSWRWAAIPVACWVLTIALPMAWVFASPDSDDPGPVGAAFLLFALVLGSSLVSLVFITKLGLGSALPAKSNTARP
jgi:hypothetical protein